jgi:hypothetical protein
MGSLDEEDGGSKVDCSHSVFQGVWSSCPVRPFVSLEQIMTEETNELFAQMTRIRRARFDLEDEIVRSHGVWCAAYDDADVMVNLVKLLHEEVMRKETGTTWQLVQHAHKAKKESMSQENAAYATLAAHVCAWEAMTGLNAHLNKYIRGDSWLDDSNYKAFKCQTCSTTVSGEVFRPGFECNCQEPKWFPCMSMWPLSCVTDRHGLYQYEPECLQTNARDNLRQEAAAAAAADKTPMPDTQDSEQEEDSWQRYENSLDEEYNVFWQTYEDPLLILADDSTKQLRKAVQSRAPLHCLWRGQLRSVGRSFQILIGL